MIQLNDLLGYKNIKIYQDSQNVCFSLDSILLAEFTNIKQTTKTILEIGSGTGAVSIILSLKTKASIDSVEIQKNLFELFKKSIAYNKLESKIHPFNCDIKDYYLQNKNNYYDLIVCNPPYFKETTLNKSVGKTLAHHELTLTIDDLILVSRKLLKDGGCLSIIYDSKRLVEVLQKMRKNNLIPKKIRFVHSKLEKPASKFLLNCVKNGNEGLKIEAPIILYNQDGSLTKEYMNLLKDKEK